MSEYLKQATDFLTKTNTEFTAKFLKHGKHFTDDTATRDIYEISLKRGSRQYKFNFGQSLNASKEFMLDVYNKPTFATKKEALDHALKCGYPVRHLTKNPNFAAPNAYDVLTCLTKYDVGTFEDFCCEFGYYTDSRKALKTYEAVKEEYKQIAILFADAEIEELCEIN